MKITKCSMKIESGFDAIDLSIIEQCFRMCGTLDPLLHVDVVAASY